MADTEIKVLDEKLRGLEYRVDCIEEEVKYNRDERNRQIEKTLEEIKSVKDEFMEEIKNLSEQFGSFQGDLLKSMNSILIKGLVAIFSVFGSAIIGLVVWIFVGNLKG